MHIPLNETEKEKTHKLDYTEIKSFEDACERLNLDPQNLPRLADIPKRYKKALMAFYKLMVIFEAINDSWVPDFGNVNQYKHFPLFVTDPSGTVFNERKDSSTSNLTKTTSYFCCETQNKADYIGKQFVELWKDYHLIARSLPDSNVIPVKKTGKDYTVRYKHGFCR